MQNCLSLFFKGGWGTGSDDICCECVYHNEHWRRIVLDAVKWTQSKFHFVVYPNFLEYYFLINMCRFQNQRCFLKLWYARGEKTTHSKLVVPFAFISTILHGYDLQIFLDDRASKIRWKTKYLVKLCKKHREQVSFNQIMHQDILQLYEAYLLCLKSP